MASGCPYTVLDSPLALPWNFCYTFCGLIFVLPGGQTPKRTVPALHSPLVPRLVAPMGMDRVWATSASLAMAWPVLNEGRPTCPAQRSKWPENWRSWLCPCGSLHSTWVQGLSLGTYLSPLSCPFSTAGIANSRQTNDLKSGMGQGYLRWSSSNSSGGTPICVPGKGAVTLRNLAH